jgi:hypothetical protein
MSSFKKVLLVLEAVVCFGAFAPMLVMGAVTSPMWLIGALLGEPGLFLHIAGGCLGAYGLAWF